METHFSNSVDLGCLGEGMTYSYLSSHPNVKQVVDVRKDKRYFQNEDVDFLIITQENDVYKVEVKTDGLMYKTNNIVYELTNSKNKGCFEKTKADVIYYYDVVNRILYQLDIKLIRKFIKSNNLQIREIGDNATGYIIPVEVLENRKILKKVFQTKYLN